MPELLWIRSDLRIADNPALSSALKGNVEGVIGLFICTPAAWKQDDWGTPRVTFLLESLREYQSSLKKLNIPLLVRIVDTYHDAARTVHEVASLHSCSSVHAGLEFGLHEQARDQNVAQRLADAGITFHLHQDQVVVPPENVLTRSGTSFKVFTPFSNAWNEQFIDNGLPPVVEPAPADALDIASDAVPSELEGFPAWAGVSRWNPGHHAALRQLNWFLSAPIDSYHVDRNRPDIDGSSSLSPWLAVGAISPVSCLRPLVEQHGADPQHWPAGPATWQSELVWREFYRYVMHHNPRVSMRRPMQEWTEHLQWREDEDGFAAWCEGRTGIDIVDAGRNQLLETGWMHNRIRMITAMFLTKNLLIDWRHGERFFARHLVDYDFPSNNGGWQWAASTGTDAVPYFRIFNPERQALRFDPEHEYRKRWNPGFSPMATPPIVNLVETRRRAIEAFKQARSLTA